MEEPRKKTDSVLHFDGMQSLLEAVFPSLNQNDSKKCAESELQLKFQQSEKGPNEGAGSSAIGQLLNKNDNRSEFGQQLPAILVPDEPQRKRKSDFDGLIDKKKMKKKELMAVTELSNLSQHSSNSSISPHSSPQMYLSKTVSSNEGGLSPNYMMPHEEFPPLNLDWLFHRTRLISWSQGLQGPDRFAEFIKLPPQMIFFGRKYEICVRGPSTGILQISCSHDAVTPTLEAIHKHQGTDLHWELVISSPVHLPEPIMIQISYNLNPAKPLLLSYPIYVFSQFSKRQTVEFVKPLCLEPRQEFCKQSMSSGRGIMIQTIESVDRKIPVVIFSTFMSCRPLIVTWPSCFYDESGTIFCRVPEMLLPANTYFKVGVMAVSNPHLLQEPEIMKEFTKNYRHLAEFYLTVPPNPIFEATSDLNARDELGFTPMLAACAYGRFQQAVRLLEQGARVDLCDPNGWNVLHWACHFGEYEFVKKVLEIAVQKNCLGAILNSPNHLHRTPLFIAIEKNRGNIVQLLLEHNASCTDFDRVHLSPLLAACISGASETLLLVGNFLKARQFLDQYLTSVELGVSALHLACLNGNLEVVRLLVTHFSQDINELDSHGNNPLYYATKGNHFSIVQYLSQTGSKIESPDQGVEDEDEGPAIFQQAIKKFNEGGPFTLPKLTDLLNPEVSPTNEFEPHSVFKIKRPVSSQRYSSKSEQPLTSLPSASDLPIGFSTNGASKKKEMLLLNWEKRPPERVVNKRQIEAFSLLLPSHEYSPDNVTWKLELINDLGNIVSHYGSGSPPILYNDLSHQKTSRGILVTFDKVKIFPSSRQKSWKLRCLALDQNFNEIAFSTSIPITICSRKEQIHNLTGEGQYQN